MSYTKQQIAAIAIECGFDAPDSGLSGKDASDELIYCEEYPCGNAIFALLEKLGIEVKDDK